MKLKRLGSIFLAAAMMTAALTGCGGGDSKAEGGDSKAEGGKSTVTLWATGSDNVRSIFEKLTEDFNTNSEYKDQYQVELQFMLSGTGAQGLADMGGAFFLCNMLLVLLVEPLEGADDGKGSALAQTAQRVLADELGDLLQLVQVLHGTLAGHDALQNLQHSFGADAAGGALAAALPLGKAHEEAGHLHHTGVLVHDHQAAGAHDGVVFFD